MSIVQICDADGKTVLKANEACEINWGYPRVYSNEAFEIVEKYHQALQDAAQECREIFKTKRRAAQVAFHKKYPHGVLPDEPDRVKVKAIVSVEDIIEDAKTATSIEPTHVITTKRNPRYET